MRTLLILAAFAALAAIHPDLALGQSNFSTDTSAPQIEVRKARAVVHQAAAVPAATPAAPVSGMASGAAFRAHDTFRLSLAGMPAEDAAQFGTAPFTIGGDGFFNIPLAGQIHAAGLTQSQLERAIERKLVESEIFRFPTATIYVEPAARFVTVGGNVRNPTRVQWAPDLTLLTAISAAGGGNDFATDKIDLIRGGKKALYRKSRIEKDPSQDPSLVPGDRIEQR
jgi:protein involved in polysaccharide export with SLBB domain